MNTPAQLNKDYWNQRYLHHQTGWDVGGVSSPLKAYIDQLTNKQQSILIPGCGNAYEAQYLVESGFENITVIDIAETLTNHLQQRWKHTPINVVHGNFFDHAGQYDLILEQTFFCALHPLQRHDYVTAMKKLLQPKGKLAGVLFITAFEDGPPFGGSREEYLPMFEMHFSNVIMDPCYNSILPRAGKEVFLLANA